MMAPPTSLCVYLSLYNKQRECMMETSTVIEQRLVETQCLQLICPTYNAHMYNTQQNDDDDDDDVIDVEIEGDTVERGSVQQEVLHVLNDEVAALERSTHLEYLKNYIQNGLPASMKHLDASRGWCLYWALHAVDLLIDDDDDEEGRGMTIAEYLQLEEHRIRNFINTLWDPQYGGYGGGPMQMSHLASTYAAIMCLIISGTEADYQAIDRERVYKFLLSMRDVDTGGFRMHHDGEVDIRGAYCAMAVASMLHILTDELMSNLVEYIRKLQTYEGGIAGEFGQEAHGGYTHCGLTALSIIGEAHKLDVHSLLRWGCKRQMGVEGGFQGRTNKLVDSCYSFWMGGIFGVLKEVFRQNGLPCNSANGWFSTQHLQLYLLMCSQAATGGLRDKPGKSPDLYHTCYALSGLSAAQQLAGSRHLKAAVDTVVGDASNVCNEIDYFYNVSLTKVQKARQYFSRHPIYISSADCLGREGRGVELFYEYAATLKEEIQSFE